MIGIGWEVTQNPNPGWADEGWPVHSLMSGNTRIGWVSSGKIMPTGEATTTFRYGGSPTFAKSVQDGKDFMTSRVIELDGCCTQSQKGFA